jgi:hypothetical protein
MRGRGGLRGLRWAWVLLGGGRRESRMSGRKVNEMEKGGVSYHGGMENCACVWLMLKRCWIARWAWRLERCIFLWHASIADMICACVVR